MAPDVYQAIADPNRRAILMFLAQSGGGEHPVSALSEALPVAITLSAVSQHLRVLRESGLVSVRKSGRERLYRLNADPLREVAEWTKNYEQFWRSRLDRLGDFLDDEEKEEKEGNRGDE
jgi:DNA-binding transcriptional ArsR family regulator